MRDFATPATPAAESLLKLVDVAKHFHRRSRRPFRPAPPPVKAVDGVSFEIHSNETVGLVGESGSGKSTLARLITRLVEPDGGRAYFRGKDVFTMSSSETGQYRREVQMVLQDTGTSFNPRVTLGKSIMRAWSVHSDLVPKRLWRDRCAELFNLVGIEADRMHWYPHQLSGGQRQRAAIARALALDPRLVICDEAVSSLDVSLQAQILSLLQELQDDRRIAYLFISHDLAVVRRIAGRVIVMYLGKVVETGDVADVYERPLHPYTRALLSAIPSTDPLHRGLEERVLIHGEPPSPSDAPSGCPFRTRCYKATRECAEEEPMLRLLGDRHHLAACHFPEA